MLEHFIDFMILVNKQVILSSAMLNSLTNLGEHVFNMLAHVVLALHHLLLGLGEDFSNEILAFNDGLEHLVGRFVRFDEVHDDVI